MTIPKEELLTTLNSGISAIETTHRQMLFTGKYFRTTQFQPDVSLQYFVLAEHSHSVDRTTLKRLSTGMDSLKKMMEDLARDVCEAKQYAKAAAENQINDKKMAEYRRRLGDIP